MMNSIEQNNHNNSNHEHANSSIHDFNFSLICEYFASISRQGPGSDEMTRKAMAMIPTLGEAQTLADLGCGCGSQTLQLALGTTAQVKALDLFPLFIEKTNERCAKAGVGARVEGIVGDMGQLPFQPASIDVIWSEGAIYNIGFAHGMQLWHAYLRAGGYVAVSEAVWLTEHRPEEIERFWLEAYPEIDTIAAKCAQMKALGYEDIQTFVLPDSCWTTNFYEPQRAAQQLFLERYANNPTAVALVDNQRHEATLYQRYHAYYGYAFFIGRKAVQ